jgi:hypothetical protein
MANPNICLSRKAVRGPGYNEQCPNKKRPDSNYCGKHTTNHTDYIIDTVVTLAEAEEAVEVVEVAKAEEAKAEVATVKVKHYTNTTDFYTLDDIESIPKEYLYDYEEAGLLYGFDIRTLHDYLQSCNPLEGYKNPYTQLAIPEKNVQIINKVYKKLQYVDSYKETLEMEPQKELEWRCLGIFQKINELGHYSEYKWFWNLNLQKLKRMYIELEDLWNYRLYLNHSQRQKILPKYIPFRTYKVNQFNLLYNLDEARTIMLNEIDKFVSLGKPEGKNGNDNKYTGSILVLTALVQVSHAAATIMSHLVPMV